MNLVKVGVFCNKTTEGDKYVRSGLILKKTRSNLFPMVQEYLRIIVR